MTTASAEFASSPLKNIRGIYLVFKLLVKPYRNRDDLEIFLSKKISWR